MRFLVLLVISQLSLGCHEPTYDISCELAPDCVARAIDDPCSECPSRAVNIRDAERASADIAEARESCAEVVPCDASFRVICDHQTCTLGNFPRD